jgi:hypothetical protein
MQLHLRLLATVLFFGCAAFAQNEKPKSIHQKNPKQPVQVVEASCGQCKFKLTGKSCDLAVRIDGKAYFVDGTKIDDHGDAHAEDGFCEAIRKAEVQGKVVDGRFKATYFKLLPEPKAGQQ